MVLACSDTRTRPNLAIVRPSRIGYPRDILAEECDLAPRELARGCSPPYGRTGIVSKALVKSVDFPMDALELDLLVAYRLILLLLQGSSRQYTH